MSEFELLANRADLVDSRVELERRTLRLKATAATSAAWASAAATVVLAIIAGDNRALGLATWLVASPVTPMAIAIAAAYRARLSRRGYRTRTLALIGLANLAFVAFGVWKALDVSRRFF